MHKNHRPPRLAEKLLSWLIRSDLAEEVLGDLEEKFYVLLQKKSSFKAQLNYWYQVFNYFRPFAIRNITRSYNSNFRSMFKHNIILTLRNFKKYKSQFFINLIGLSSGLACVLFIYLWVTDEINIDRFHATDNQLYQIMSNHTDANGVHTWKGVPGLLLDEIKSSVPEVVNAVAATDTHEYSISVDDSNLKVNGKFVSEEFFDVFSYPLKHGDIKTALTDKEGIVITESLAMRLFNSEDVIGEIVKWHFWGNTKTLKVTGILKEIPAASSEKFDFLMSWDYYHDDLITYKQWGNYYARIIVVLNNNSSEEPVNTKVTHILQEKQNSDRVTLFLTKYSDMYLYSNYENGVQTGGRIEYVNLFSIIAIFILFIACVNFINLSTAKAAHRTKEIGVKKSLGASRKSLISQYFTESIFLCLISLIVAFILVYSFLPQFNYVVQKQLSINFDGQLLFTSIILIIIVGIFAGSYPALYLSGFDPIKVLKGKLIRKNGEVFGRKALVVIQFTLSIILIVAVVVILKQMEFVKNKNLGFDRDNLIYFEREGKLIENSDAFIAELKNIPGIENAVVSGFMAGDANSTGGVSWPGKTDKDQMQFLEIRSGYGLVEIMNMQLLEGRSFSNEFGLDSAGIIFNEAAIAAMGIEDPIGKSVWHYTGNKKIVGVVKDFNLFSLHTKIEPTLFLYAPENTHFIMAKLKTGDEASTIERIESLYKSFNPGYAFKSQFVDQDYQALYASEEKVAVLSRYFAGFAVIISCLGLFGLASFTVESKFKEIGIRKILGSGSVRIIYMLSSDFTKMVITAIFIALPTSYFIITKWLENFAYSINLEWWFFVGAGLIALIIAWLTVGLQTIKAANINPAQCLRDE